MSFDENWFTWAREKREEKEEEIRMKGLNCSYIKEKSKTEN